MEVVLQSFRQKRVSEKPAEIAGTVDFRQRRHFGAGFGEVGESGHWSRKTVWH